VQGLFIHATRLVHPAPSQLSKCIVYVPGQASQPGRQLVVLLLLLLLLPFAYKI